MPPNVRWEQVNVPAGFSAEVRARLITDGWGSVDLFGEVLKGADPVPRLLQLGQDPARLDRYWDEVSQGLEQQDEGEEEAQEGEGQVPDEPQVGGEGGGVRLSAV